MSLNQKQFINLHTEYHDRLLNSATAMTRNRQDAEDITADAFASAFKNRDHFRGDAAPRTWVYAIAANEARSRRRSERFKLQSIEQLDETQLRSADVLDETIERGECRTGIRSAMRRVPARYRRVIIDHFVRGYSVREIAGQYGIPVGTVLTRLFKAKRLLRAAWEGRYGKSCNNEGPAAKKTPVTFSSDDTSGYNSAYANWPMPRPQGSGAPRNRSVAPQRLRRVHSLACSKNGTGFFR